MDIKNYGPPSTGPRKILVKRPAKQKLTPVSRDNLCKDGSGQSLIGRGKLATIYIASALILSVLPTNRGKFA